MLRSFRLLIAAALAALPATLRGQAAPLVVVHLRVVDTTSAPVAGADVSIVNGLHDVLAAGTTDGGGRATLSIRGGTPQHEAVARKIGFSRTSTFFAAHHDTVGVTLIMRRPPQQLPTVTVTEREDVKRRSYHMDADDIANSSRPIFTAKDAVMKLKPDIRTGRDPYFCGGAQDIWVNGKLIRLEPLSSALPSLPTAGRRSPRRPMPRISPSQWVDTVLAFIKPEHVAEMDFKDCYDTTVDRVHGNSALFVVLKEGIAFEMWRGSYVIDVSDTPRIADSVATPVAPENMAYRNRLLGVYDALTGDPVPDVAVTDSLSGVTAKTTSTGTVTLMFLPEGESTLRISKPGYAAQSVGVSISPRDTLPITLVLTKTP